MRSTGTGKIAAAQKEKITEPEQFKVAVIGEGKCTLASYNRRDFFKITLVTKCDSTLHQEGQTFTINKPV